MGNKENNINLLSFEEALRKLKNNEMQILIRMKHAGVDYLNKSILLYNSKQYITLMSSGISGQPDCLYITRFDEIGNKHSSVAEIISEDILAEDYIDTSGWQVFKYSAEYDKKIRNMGNG